jgi:hypothetical protein
MTVVSGLQSVKAERDAANRAMEKDSPPVLHAQLVKLRHGVYLNAFLDPYREHVSKFWSDESTEQVEAEHCELFKLHGADIIIRSNINSHTTKTTFNDAFFCAPKLFERLCSFCGGLATVFANKSRVRLLYR